MATDGSTPSYDQLDDARSREPLRSDYVSCRVEVTGVAVDLLLQDMSQTESQGQYT